jgi:adenosylhomocysteine nucleosidase
MTSRLGIVTGLKSEAALLFTAIANDLPRPAIMVQCRGPGPERAARAAEILLSAGCTALMSFGLAGGLAPMLGTGTLIIPRSVVRLPATHDSAGIDVHPLWHAALTGRFKVDFSARMSTAPLVSSAQVVANAADKKALYEALGAVAVDMESYAVAEVAQANGVPFAACRIIMDPAGQSIPAPLRAAMTEDGDVDMKAGLKALLRAPMLIPEARRLQKQSDKVHKELEQLLRSDLLTRRFLVDVTHV